MTKALAAHKALPAGWVARHVIYDGSHLRLEYTGPALGATARVLVAFAPYDYPFQTDAGGWGTKSFAKRGIAHVCVFHCDEDWHQNAEFFTAMQACRAFFGPIPQLTTYGFSMGGYGAMLGAQAMDAYRAIAISPQSSIDPAAVRFEKRYGAQWAKMAAKAGAENAGWLHDLAAHMDDKRAYIVMFDPMHRQDTKHEARLPKRAGYTRILLYGAGHAGIQSIVEMGQSEVLFDLLRGDTGAHDMRRAYRAGRRTGFRYLRGVGTFLHERGKPAARLFFDIAKVNDFHRLTKKWTPFYK